MNKWMKSARYGSLAIVLVLLGAFLATADIEKTLRAFTGIRWRPALWVPLLNVANTFVESVRLSLILRPVTSRFGLRNSFNASLIGIIGNVALPLRFGDGARAYYISRTEKISLSSSLSALMLDRIADFLLFFAMMAVAAFLLPFPPSVARTGMIAALIFAAAVIAVFALTGAAHRAGRNGGGPIRNRIAREVREFVSGLSAMRNAGIVLPVLAVSALSWFLRALMIWFMLEAFSLDLPAAATPVTLILVNLGIALVSSPANVGGFELAAVAALKLFSVEIEVGLGYAVALHAIEVVPMAAFGLVFLWFEGFKTVEALKSAGQIE